MKYRVRWLARVWRSVSASAFAICCRILTRLNLASHFTSGAAANLFVVKSIGPRSGSNLAKLLPRFSLPSLLCTSVCMVYLGWTAVGHSRLVNAADAKRAGAQRGVERASPDLVRRISDRDSYLILTRAHLECLSHDDIKSALNDIQQKLEGIDREVKLRAVESLLGSSDGDSIAAARALMKQINTGIRAEE